LNAESEIGVFARRRTTLTKTELLLLLLLLLGGIWRKLLSQNDGAGEGNRTLVSALGRPHSTIEPHPPMSSRCLAKNISTGNCISSLLSDLHENAPWGCFELTDSELGEQ
jgi:hypothetical protein